MDHSIEDSPGELQQLCSVTCGPMLGEGTSGAAYAVSSAIDGCRYALKRVHVDTHEELARARHEVTVHAKLLSPSIVKYAYSWEERAADGGHLLNILLERCDRELWDALTDAASRPSPFERHVWSMALLEAMQELSLKKVVHRDINPWNVWLAGIELRLGDLGLAAHLPPGGVLEGADTAGAPPLDSSALGSLYSAPELGAVYGAAADVFSAGMVLFAVWAGACPTAAAAGEDELTTHTEAVRASGSVPGWFEQECVYAAVIARMVSHQPGARPSVVECAHAFRSTPPMGKPVPAPVGGRRRSSVGVLGGSGDGGAGGLRALRRAASVVSAVSAFSSAAPSGGAARPTRRASWAGSVDAARPRNGSAAPARDDAALRMGPTGTAGTAAPRQQPSAGSANARADAATMTSPQRAAAAPAAEIRDGSRLQPNDAATKPSRPQLATARPLQLCWPALRARRANNTDSSPAAHH